MFVCIQDNWPMLLESIQTGKLPTDLNIDVTLRKKLESKLSPNPERANELEAIRSKHNASAKGKGASFARLIWPSLHTILAVETGSFAIYGEKLRNEFIGDDITIYSPLYAATEVSDSETERMAFRRIEIPHHQATLNALLTYLLTYLFS